MEFKNGIGWRCCYDPATGRYTAETGGGPNHNLYEITKEIYDHVDDPDVQWPTRLIGEGRHLYMTVNDRCGPPYTVILDTDYKEICPWAETITTGTVWDEDMTDAAVEVFASEANNRAQRRVKKSAREKAAKKDLENRPADHRLGFQPSREMKISVLPEQEDQLCTKETIREVFEKDDKGECMAYDIYDGEVMVGFAMFCQHPEGCFFLWNYAIDAAYQNQGIGTKALRELLEYMVSHYHVKQFTTTYVWGNEHAKRLYETVGFVETDVVEEEDYKEVNMIYHVLPADE